MRILELSLRNYRVFEEVELELPARVIGIFGENGSGKTSLLESIAFALYGVEATRTKKQYIRTHGILTDCEVRLVFEHAGHQHEVRRSIRGRGHMPEAELYAGGLLVASGTTDVDAEIRRLLHMDLHVFRSSVYAEQKQLDAFSSLRPAERREMALRLLGIKPVDEAVATARREARAAKDGAGQLAGAVGDLAALEADLKDAKDAAAEVKKLAKAAAEALKEAATEERAAVKSFADIDAARQRVEKLTVQLLAKTGEHGRLVEQRAAVTERAETLAESIAELPSLEEELAGLADVEGRLRAATQLADAASKLVEAETALAAVPEVDAAVVLAELELATRAHADAQLAAAGAEAERGHRASLFEEAHLRLARAEGADPSEPCPTCGRPLGADFAEYVRHVKADLAATKKEAAEAAKAAKSASTARTAAEKALRGAETAGEQARRAADRRTSLLERLEQHRSEVSRLAEPFGGETPDLDALRASAERATALGRRVAELGAQREHLEHTRRDLGTIEDRVTALEAELAALAEEAEALSFDEAEHARLGDELASARQVHQQARDTERSANDAANDAGKRVSELTGALGQARETAARVDELRSEARYVDRVAMLLDGFRDHLVARVGPELSREAESLFRELTDREYDDLRIDEETLSIQIADGDTYFPIGRFSGSETDLANLALRVAISTHLSRMSGSDVGMMVLDEVLGSLDEERKDLLVQTLGRLSSRFHQLFVITHAERVKDQFPASILVQKTGRRRSSAMLV
ncbi:MAG: SMC family ATPase [Gaiellales bacterium]